MSKLTLGNIWGLFVLIDESLKSSLGTELKIRELIPELVNPGEDVVVLLFVKMNDPFEIVHVSVEFKKHLF